MRNTESFKEISPLSAKDCFILFERYKTNFNFPVHTHPEYELNFIENAQGAQRIVGDSIEEIGNEELVLIANPKLEHAWADCHNIPQEIHEITIQFHPDLLKNFLEKDQMASIQRLFQHAERGILFSPDTTKKIRPLIKTLTCENDNFYSLIKFLIILHELSKDNGIRELSTHSFALEGKDSSAEDYTLSQVIAYINQHYTENIHLDDVADLANMSKPTFCRFIKQHTSKSFLDFLTDIRLGIASRKLIDTTDSIAEIGYVCGFNNLSNFNRIFKKKKGVTPTDFRNTYHKRRAII